MEKENISIESSEKDFTEIINKINELKDKIKNEINKINLLYDKTIEELSRSFEEKREKLIKEENNIKEKLQNEVTKVKEKLENILTEVNNQINISDKINKGFKKFDKQEKNLMKILSYVSKINENKENMNTLLTKTMKSINFSLSNEINDINIEEFYINGKFVLKQIENGNCELDYGGNTQGRLLFDSITDNVYYVDGYNLNKINVYRNYENFKLKQCEIQLELPSQISASYSVIHRGFFYYFIYSTNNLVKYDLNKKKIIINKEILPDAALDNQNQWGGNNNINFSQMITIYMQFILQIIIIKGYQLVY